MTRTMDILNRMRSWLLMRAYQFLRKHTNIVFIEPKLTTETTLQSWKIDSRFDTDTTSMIIMQVARQLESMEDTLDDAYQILTEAETDGNSIDD